MVFVCCAGYSAEGLIFDWNQNFVDAALVIPEDHVKRSFPDINWSQYKNWDIIRYGLTSLHSPLTTNHQPLYSAG